LIMSRPNLGLEHVEKLEGGRETKSRLRMVLETLAGSVSVNDAAERLGMSPSRFSELRDQALLGALEALAPRAAGRPPTRSREALEVLDLKRELRDVQHQLEVERVRTEILMSMPEVVLGKALPPRGTRGPGGGGGKGTRG
jgi:transposase-like protein